MPCWPAQQRVSPLRSCCRPSGRGRAPLAGDSADTRAVTSARDLPDRAGGIGADGLGLRADLSRPPDASDSAHGKYWRSVDVDHLFCWEAAQSLKPELRLSSPQVDTMQEVG